MWALWPEAQEQLVSCQSFVTFSGFSQDIPVCIMPVFSQLGLINLHKRISCDVYDRLVAVLADNSIFLSKGTKPQAHVKVQLACFLL